MLPISLLVSVCDGMSLQIWAETLALTTIATRRFGLGVSLFPLKRPLGIEPARMNKLSQNLCIQHCIFFKLMIFFCFPPSNWGLRMKTGYMFYALYMHTAHGHHSINGCALKVLIDSSLLWRWKKYGKLVTYLKLLNHLTSCAVLFLLNWTSGK